MASSHLKYRNYFIVNCLLIMVTKFMTAWLQIVVTPVLIILFSHLNYHDYIMVTLSHQNYTVSWSSHSCNRFLGSQYIITQNCGNIPFYLSSEVIQILASHNHFMVCLLKEHRVPLSVRRIGVPLLYHFSHNVANMGWKEMNRILLHGIINLHSVLNQNISVN